jgi:pimeloyl-ACP methyl ester carboxylesterase
MPLIAILRVVFGVFSCLVLAAAGYLLWTWSHGSLRMAPDGRPFRIHEDWRLWTALALLAWSLLGRWLTLPLIARGGGGPVKARHRPGQMLTGASGAQIHVEASGRADGPTIILTHGWGLDSTIWTATREALEADYRVLVWDLPGLGKSRPAADGAISLTDFAADLGTVIGLADQPVILVGHSIGGMTIQTLARDNPALFARRVAGVVLLNTTYTNPLRTMILSRPLLALRWPVLEPLMRLAIWLQPLAWLGAWQGYLNGTAHLANRLGFGRYVTRAQLEHTTLLATRNPPGAQAKGNLAMFRWDATETLPTITRPTLVVGGDLDIVTKLEASRIIAATVPAGRLQVVAGVNHMGFLERADEYNRAILDFASALRGGSRDAAA